MRGATCAAGPGTGGIGAGGGNGKFWGFGACFGSFLGNEYVPTCAKWSVLAVDFDTWTRMTVLYSTKIA